MGQRTWSLPGGGRADRGTGRSVLGTPKWTVLLRRDVRRGDGTEVGRKEWSAAVALKLHQGRPDR